MKTIKSSRAEANRQTGTAQEPKERPLQGRKHSSMPIRADTAAYHVGKWIENNPNAYDKIAQRAIALRKAGRRVSITSLFEWFRVESALSIGNSSPFKVNNNLKAAFSRALMRDYPELKGAFETRKSKCDWAFSEDESKKSVNSKANKWHVKKS